MGDGGTLPRRLILKVTVDLETPGNAESSSDAEAQSVGSRPKKSQSEAPVILVHEGDDAHSLAVQFCAEHGLQDELVPPLASHITEKMKLARAKPVVPAKQKAKDPKVCWSCGNPFSRDVQFCRRCGTRRAWPQGTIATSQSAGVSTDSTPKRQSMTSTESRTPRANGAKQGVGGASSPRFLRLFEDSVQRKFRMQRLKNQVEKDEAQRLQSSMQVAPGTARYAAWQRRSTDLGAAPGERLHNDAARRALKMRHLQEMRDELQRQQEEQEATFKPVIEVSQRRIQGTSRSLQDPAGLKTRMKMERLRNIKEQAEMDGCTFKPDIDQKSAEMISQRLARLKITGTLYDSLYEDAVRRRERHLESVRALPPGVTFQPDIGMDPSKASMETKEDFINRLAYSRSYSDRWVSLRRQKQESDRQSKDLGGQPEFHPRTGRGPLIERNKDGLPIGDFLFGLGRRGSATPQALSEEAPLTPQVGENSRQLFEETKQRTFRLLFDLLTSKDAEGELQAESICLDGLDADLRSFLQPMVSFLESTGQRMEFEAFCSALDYQRQHAAMPTAHLFTQRGSRIWKEKAANPEMPVPKIDQNSARLASKRRSRSVPLHVQLFRERDVRDARMEERRLLAEEVELQECTFRPRLRHRDRIRALRRSLSPRSFQQDSMGFTSSPSPSPRRDGYPMPEPCEVPPPRTPRGPGAPGGPGPVSSVGASSAMWMAKSQIPRPDDQALPLHTPPGPHLPAPSPTASRGSA